MTPIGGNERWTESEWSAYGRSALNSWVDALELLANGEEDKSWFSPSSQAMVDGVDLITNELFAVVPITALFLAISDGRKTDGDIVDGPQGV
jgi:hypothetical protein